MVTQYIAEIVSLVSLPSMSVNLLVFEEIFEMVEMELRFEESRVSLSTEAGGGGTTDSTRELVVT